MNKNYNKFSLLLLITLLMLKSNVLSAEDQSTTYLGGYINYNYHMHSVKDGFPLFYYFEKSHDLIKYPKYIVLIPVFSKGTGSGVDLGGLFERRLNSDFSIGCNIGASFSDINFITDTGYVYSKNWVVVDSFIYHNQYFDLKFYSINLTPYITYNIYKGLFASLGLNLGLIIHSEATGHGKFDAYSIYYIGGYKCYEYNGEERDNKDAFNDFSTDSDSNCIKTFQLGLPIGLGYDLHIGRGIILTPSIKYNLALTSFSDKRDITTARDRSELVKTNWIANKIEFGLAVKFPISSEEIIEEDIIKDESNLSADLNIYGIDTNGNRISNPTLIIEEVETEEHFPLLSTIYFPEGSSNLSDTRTELLDDIGVSNFREEHLKSDAISINHSLLNIIAYRMYYNKDSKIIVVGYSNENESSELALERANTVKKYLVDVWGTTPDKITVRTDKILNKSTSSDAIEENSRVEILPADLSSYVLFTPITLSFIDKISNPPMIEFEPSVEADAGFSNLVLDISQKGNTIKQFNTNSTSNILWTVEGIEYDSPLNVTLLARDFNNSSVKIDKEVSIENITMRTKKETIIKDSGLVGNYKIERYSLILFEYDKSDISKLDAQNIKNIKSRIKPNSKVLISGFGDRNGTQQYNKNLAHRRCEEVAKLLGVKNAIIRAVGNDNLLFDNSFPEGRALSRTVRIEIKTPIK